jgi:hypothetical protein
MDKESFILQTTRAGRLSTNAVFADERTARLETERALNSGEFEHIRLTVMLGADKKTLLDVVPPKNGGRSASKNGKLPAARKKQVSGAILIGRFSMLVTLVLILMVVWYFARPYFS